MLKSPRDYIIIAVVIIIVTSGLVAWRNLPGVPFAANPPGGSLTGAEPGSAQAEVSKEQVQTEAREVGANELGLVPVLVYHLIGEQEGRWTRTPANFRRDLQELHDRDFVLVPLTDYLTGNMDVPAGKSPAIITFDDSTAGQFRLVEKAGQLEVDPNCAVGMLRQFGEQHPGFGHAATFYVNAQPFGQSDLWQKKLQMLNEWGFEIGNHTYGHKNLKGLSAAQVADEIARLQEHVQEAVPGYQPTSFAIVQDGLPEPYDAVMNGQQEDTKYEHQGVVWWAWSASRSPFHKEFDRSRIQRIQVFDDQGASSLVNWLERITATKYVSDGRPDTLAIPEGWQEEVVAQHDRELVIYQPDEPVRDPAVDQQASKAKGMHVTYSWASGRDRWEGILALAEKTQMNTVQLDVKDESGRIGYLSEVAMAKETGAGRDMLPIRDMLKELRAREIYSVARIVIFRDPFLAQQKPQLMVRDKNGAPLMDGVWVDIYSQEVWDYNIELAREAYELGFDEVQFDYIRFPEGTAAKTAIYGAKNDDRHRVDVIADFLSYARAQLGWHKVISATVFGFAGFAVDDMGIGQRPERMAPYVDYLSPMVYPSHYSQGNYGVANPNAHPLVVVDGSIKDFQELTAATGCQLRPWLQSFTMGSPAYGRNEIRAQIKATEQNGIDTWLLWNAGCQYKAENITS